MRHNLHKIILIIIVNVRFRKPYKIVEKYKYCTSKYGTQELEKVC